MGRGRSLPSGEKRQLQVAPRRLLDTFGVAGLHQSRFFGYGEHHGAAGPPPRARNLPPDQLSLRKRAGTLEKPATRRFRRARTETVVIACECFVAFLSCMSLNTRNHVGAGAPVTVIMALILSSKPTCSAVPAACSRAGRHVRVSSALDAVVPSRVLLRPERERT